MKPKLLKNKWFLAFVIAAVLAVAAIVVAIVIGVTSNNGPDDPYVEGDEIGVFYYDVVDGEILLTLSGGNKFTIAGPSINKTGTYTVDGSNIVLDFVKDDDGTAAATINGDTVTLVYDNATMLFLKKVNYTVNFNVNGGNAISAAKVVNGKTVTKPADPTKENNVFLGWYADEAFTTPFDFDATTVKADITVYAKWAEKTAGVADYTVKFDLGYEGAEKLDDIVTISGIAYGVTTPEREGYTFGGWWISMYEDGAKLSYAYTDGTVFKADTTLYAVWYDNSSTKLNAPAVSVTENTITWNSVKDAASYKLTVIDPDGNVVIDNETVGATTKAFSFADGKPGEYKISVVAVASNEENNSVAAERYFANKTLDRVSDFTVDNGILVFGAVENAQKYIITIDCGNDGHVHTAFDNGSSTTYYIGNCPMQEGGILINVTASANGYASSTSKVFAYDKALDKIENLVYDATNDKFTWSSVAGAAAYNVTVKIGDDEYTFNTTNASFSVAGFTGNINVSVVPVTEGYNSPAAATASCNKTAPAAPNGLAAAGNVISWNAVEGATSYEVKIGTQTVTVSTNEFNFTDGSVSLTQGQMYQVKVKAINENGESSVYSDVLTVGYFAMDTAVTYSKNTVYWSPVLGASQYQVRVNGGAAINVTDATSAKVTLTKEGENLIEVRYVYGETFSDWVSVTVMAYAVEYDTRSVAYGSFSTEYLAVGDLMTLPSEGFSVEGYDFTGWYNAPKGAAGNGKLYAEGSVFTGNAYTVVYAEWTPKTYNVTLNTNGFDITNIENGTQMPAIYTKDFTLPVPVANNTGMYYFAGWYIGSSGTGAQLTDENGNSVAPYPYTEDVTVYPYYSTNALTFTLQEDGTYAGTYAVSKGETIGSVTNLTIPVTYNEIPVTVISENAFSSCSSIVKVEIPDTIRLVGIGAFNGCTNLEYIDVYVAKPDEEGQYETFYSDDDGVLIREDMGTTWLEYFPRAMTGEYTISEDVEMILPKAFYFSKITKITIPKSINSIPEYAFYSCTSLEEVVFEGGRTTPIEFFKSSFYFPSYNSNIKSITLPAMFPMNLTDLKSMLNMYTKLVSIDVEKGGEEYSSIGGILTDANEQTILYCPRGYAGDITIPNGITTIGEKAFENCDFITSITIPVWVTSIEKYAFQYCEGNKSIVFKGDRSEDLDIGEDAFWCNYDLETITFEGNTNGTLDEGKITMGRLVFYGSRSSSKLHTVTIGDGVYIESLPQQAFQTQTKLRNFIVSEKAYIGSIADKAFQDCESLEYFKVPATVTMIETNAFDGCIKLSNLEFATAEGEKELTLATGAFNDCTALKSVELPDRLKEFDSSAFQGCTNLKAITVRTTNENYVTDDNGILYAKNYDENQNIVYTELLFYPKALVKENNGIINNLPDTLTVIGGSAFSDNNYLKSVIIPANVTSIGNFAFANCENLSDVQFSTAASADGEKITLEVGNSAFLNCKSLTNDFRLPSYTSSIGSAAFQGCEFTKFIVPEGVTFIGFAAFWGSETLEEVEFKCTGDLVIENGTNNAATGGGAFSNCTALTRVDLPAGLTELGNYTFYKCYALKTVNIGKVTVTDGVYTVDSKLIRIGNRAFEQCIALESIIIPKSVVAIGTNAFAATEKPSTTSPGPGNLTSIIFEKGGTEELHLAGGVFGWQTHLTTITLPERVSLFSSATALERKDEKNSALKDVNGNKIYYAPTDETTLNITALKNTFNGCLALAEINIEEDENVTGLYSSLDGVLYNADKTVLIYCPFANVGIYKNGEPTYEIIVPNTVKTVFTYAFVNCTELKTLTFEEFDVTDERYGTPILSIGNYAATSKPTTASSYYYVIGGPNSAITKVSLPSHLKNINLQAFQVDEAMDELAPMEIIFNQDAKNVEIAKYAFNGCTVKELLLPGIKSIGDYAFTKCAKLEKITFASLDTSIKKLPNYMLQGAVSLKEFTIPAEITELGTYVFDGCTSLTSIDLNNVTKLGNYSFRGTGLTSLTITSKIAKAADLGTNTFQNCTSLVTVTFEPKADGKYPLTELSASLFSGCTAMTTINIYDFANQITKFGNSTFYQCESLPAFDFTKFTSLKTLGTTTFSYNPNYVKVDLSKTKITSISSAFNNLKNLKEFIFPEFMTSDITSSSFTNDTALEKVYLTKSYKPTWLSNVNSYIIQKSNVPVEVIIPEDNSNFTVDEFGVVYDPAMQLVYFVNPTADLSEYTLPESVHEIKSYAFAYNKSLKNLVIPEGVTLIDTYAFYYSGITSVVIPSTVTKINNYAFQHSELAELTFTDTLALPSKLTELGNNVFSYTKLVDVVLPDQLSKFGTSGTFIFAYIDTLKSVTTGASMKEIPNGFIAYTPSLENLYMQEGIETIRWIFSSNYYIGDYGVHNLTSIYIPASVKTIESDAFCDMISLKTVTFAEGSVLETIGAHAFRNCTALEAINGLPESVKTIGQYAFADCKSLSALDLSATAVTEIGDYAFQNTESMTTFALPSGLTSIGAYAFYNTGIKDLYIPETVTSLGNSAFENSALETVTFPTASTMTSLGNLQGTDGKDTVANVFKGTSKLETVVLSNALKTIARGAFANSAVKNVLMADENSPSTLAYIGDSAFESCVNLTGFAYLEQVTEIGEKAFFRCSNLENTVVSEGLTSLGAMAFAFCDKLTEGYIPSTLTTLGGNPYVGLDKSKINVSEESNSFIGETDEDGVLTIYDIDKNVIYAVYGATGAYEIPETTDNASYAVGALAGNAITEVNIPARLETVPDYMFMNCTELASVTISDELTTIGQYAFYNTGLTTVVIPSTVTTINDYAFAYCTSINNVVIPKSVTTIGNYVFAYCATLSNFEFESFAEDETVKAQVVGTHFFYNCPNITEVILPDKINITTEDATASGGSSYKTTIPSYMFSGTGIVNAVIPASVTYFHTSGVFANCKSLETVHYGTDAQNSYADYSTTWYVGCDKLEGAYIDSITHYMAYVVEMCYTAGIPSLHVGSINESPDLYSTSRFSFAGDLTIYFDGNTYQEIVDYMAIVSKTWECTIYDKDGNQLHCSENKGSIAYVTDANGNVIWTAEDAE